MLRLILRNRTFGSMGLVYVATYEYAKESYMTPGKFSGEKFLEDGVNGDPKF